MLQHLMRERRSLSASCGSLQPVSSAAGQRLSSSSSLLRHQLGQPRALSWTDPSALWQPLLELGHPESRAGVRKEPAQDWVLVSRGF